MTEDDSDDIVLTIFLTSVAKTRLVAELAVSNEEAPIFSGRSDEYESTHSINFIKSI